MCLTGPESWITRAAEALFDTASTKVGIVLKLAVTVLVII